MTHTVKFLGGCPIALAAEQLVAAAAEHGEAEGRFNGITLRAARNSTIGGVVSEYERQSDAAAEAYQASPEGKAAEAARERRRSDLQAKHDALMRRLPQLDFTNDGAVLDWLCEMQDASDHVGVIVRRKTIVQAFAAHDYRLGGNCGADFRPNSRENVHRWLVGQALDGLDTGPSIHGIIHKFAAEWKAKFVDVGCAS